MPRRRCRSTTIYFDPKTKVRFSGHVIFAVAANGDSQRVTHRRDIERFAETHPGWDGTCYTAAAGAGAPRELDLDTFLTTYEPRCRRIDPATANGRRPRSEAAAVYSLATGTCDPDTLQAAISAAIDDPQAAASVRAAVGAADGPAAAAQRFRYLAAAAAHLDRSELTKLANHIAGYDSGVAPLALDTTTLNLSGLARFDRGARLGAAMVLWDDHQHDLASSALSSARHASYRHGTQHPFVRTVVELADRHPDVWVAAIDAELTDYDGWLSVAAFTELPFSPQVISQLARRNRTCRNAAGLHPNGTVDHLRGALVDDRWLYDLSELELVRLDPERGSVLAEHLAGRLREPADEARTRKLVELAALAAEADPSRGDVFVDAAGSWLSHVRRLNSAPAMWGSGWTTRSIDLDRDQAAALRRHLRRDNDTAAPAETSFATVIGRSSQIGPKFRTRVTRDFELVDDDPADAFPAPLADRIRDLPRRPSAHWGTPRSQRNAAASAALQSAIIDPTCAQSTFNDLLTMSGLDHSAQRAMRSTWDVVRNNGWERAAANGSLTSLSGGTDTLLAMAAAAGTDVSADTFATLVSASSWVDPEHFAAAALCGVDVAAVGNSDLDRLVETTSNLASGSLTNTIWPARLSSIDELPQPGDRPWDLDRRVVERAETVAVHTSEFGPLTVSAIGDVVELRHNASQMRNCTASYRRRIAAGEVIILAARDSAGATAANIAVERDGDGTWSVGEINTWANGGATPDDDQALRNALNDALRGTRR
jgi:hypothetical protein